MFAYKEILTLDDPRTLTLAQALPLPRGRRIEVLILDQEEDRPLAEVRAKVATQGVSESDVAEAIAWARG